MRIAVLAAILAVPACAAAQEVAPNRSTAYLHPTDVRDARAVWVNPAGLAVLREASVYADVAVQDPGRKGRLGQISAGFNARGLAFAYQRDVFDGGRRGHTYRLGLAGAAQGLAGGAAMALYRGDTKASGWDVGLTYSIEGATSLTVGGVIANIGQPVVRGLPQRVTYIPGATWRPLGPASALSIHARLTSHAVIGYAFGLSWQGSRGGGGGGGNWPLAVLARLDTDGGLRRGAFALGLSIGGPDRVGVVASTPGDLSGVDAVSLWGLSSRQPAGRR